MIESFCEQIVDLRTVFGKAAYNSDPEAKKVGLLVYLTLFMSFRCFVYGWISHFLGSFARVLRNGAAQASHSLGGLLLSYSFLFPTLLMLLGCSCV